MICARQSSAYVVPFFNKHFNRTLSLSVRREPVADLTSVPALSARAALFQSELERRQALIARVQKIEVNVKGIPESCQLIMNKNLSTPYDCAKHLSDAVTIPAALALVNGEVWDMHCPLEGDCELEYLYFTDTDPFRVNNAYWRSCTFLLGAIVSSAFKAHHQVQLHSWPNLDYKTGSFMYDISLNTIPHWRPTKQEYRILSRIAVQHLRDKKFPFQRLDVSVKVAQQIFQDNPFKLNQLESIAAKSKVPGTVPLYRLGDHVDISRGPMVSHSGQFGYYDVTLVEPHETDFGTLHRFQGVSVPYTQRVNSWTWELLCKAASQADIYPAYQEEQL